MKKNYIVRKLIKEFVGSEPLVKPITKPDITPKRRPLKPNPDNKPDIRPKANKPEIAEPITKPDIRPKRRPLKPNPDNKPDIRPKAFISFNKKEKYTLAKILKKFKKLGGYKTNTMNEAEDDLRSSLSSDWYDKQTRDKENEYSNRRPNTMRMLSDVQKAIQLERNNRDKLEDLAINTVENYFPVVKDLDVIINAKLVDAISGVGNVSTERSEKVFSDVMKDEVKKRRIINAMTQGGAANVMNISYAVKDKLDNINPELINLYKSTEENTVFSWKTPNDVLRDMIVMGTKSGMAHGLVNVDFKNGAYYINAQAVTFNILIHEIVKGIFEILSVHGMTDDKSINTEILDYVDYVGNEPEDLKYGELLYDNIRDFFIDNFDSEIDEIPTLKEHFLASLYQLPAKDFMTYINGILDDNTRIKNEVKQYLREVYIDVKQDNQDELFN